MLDFDFKEKIVPHYFAHAGDSLLIQIISLRNLWRLKVPDVLLLLGS